MNYPTGPDQERRRSHEPRRNVWSNDLESLDVVSRHGIPKMTDTKRAFQETLEKRYRGGPLMNSIRNFRSRPWLSTSLGAAAVAAFLLFVPISYERTVGHDLVLGLQSDSMTENTAQEITDEVARLFGAERVNIRHAPGVDYAVHARVDGRSRGELELLVAAYAAELASRGVETHTNITSIVEKMTGNVYAAAANSFGSITIRTDGMSADEIADDIRSQLEAAGIYGAEIDVDVDGECKQIRVHLESNSEDDLPEIVCEDDAIEGCKMIDIRRTPEMTDAEVCAEVKRQLAEQGVEADVSIDMDGKIKIDTD